MNLLLALLVFTWLWLGLLTYWLIKTVAVYRRLTKDASGQDLNQIWRDYLSQAKKNNQAINDLMIKVDQLTTQARRHLQKVGLVRFNPYHDLGGNQSFAVGLLDEGGNGVVLSSLHGRDSTRIYAKPVKDFSEVGFKFSTEEKNAIHHSQNA